MLILTPDEIEFCGVQRPGGQPRFGFKFKQWSFYLESQTKLEWTEALTRCRAWMENPENPWEQRVILKDSAGYQLAIYAPDLEHLPYETLLLSVCDHMRNSGQLQIGGHRWGLRVFENSFIGSEAVTWLANYLQVSREEAVEFGQKCIEAGIFAHVLGEQALADEYYFYRFIQDGIPEPRALN